jgi:hypothetical protein
VSCQGIENLRQALPYCAIRGQLRRKPGETRGR